MTHRKRLRTRPIQESSGVTPPRTDDGPPHTGPPFVVDPAPGAEIASNTQFSLTFDLAAVAVTVNGVAATGSGLNWTRIAGATRRRRPNPER